jgi:hypothetical protein
MLIECDSQVSQGFVVVKKKISLLIKRLKKKNRRINLSLNLEYSGYF